MTRVLKPLPTHLGDEGIVEEPLEGRHGPVRELPVALVVEPDGEGVHGALVNEGVLGQRLEEAEAPLAIVRLEVHLCRGWMIGVAAMGQLVNQ